MVNSAGPPFSPLGKKTTFTDHQEPNHLNELKADTPVKNSVSSSRQASLKQILGQRKVSVTKRSPVRWVRTCLAWWTPALNERQALEYFPTEEVAKEHGRCY